jgi:hypothetical protein
MSRKTTQAQNKFSMIQRNFPSWSGGANREHVNLGAALAAMASGLELLAGALRDIYDKLEQLESRLARS